MEYFKGDTEYVRNAVIEIATSSTKICQARPRKLLYFRNNGANNITIHMGNGLAVVNEGIVLKAGGTYAEANSEGFQVYTGTITAIAETGATNLAIVER